MFSLVGCGPLWSAFWYQGVESAKLQQQSLLLEEMTETEQQIHGAAIKRGSRGVRLNSGEKTRSSLC